MNAAPKDPDKMRIALDLLAENLAGSKFRDALRQSPADAAKEAGISVDDLPGGLLATLGTMGDGELLIAAQVQQALKRSTEQFPEDSKVCILF